MVWRILNLLGKCLVLGWPVLALPLVHGAYLAAIPNGMADWRLLAEPVTPLVVLSLAWLTVVINPANRLPLLVASLGAGWYSWGNGVFLIEAWPSMVANFLANRDYFASRGDLTPLLTALQGVPSVTIVWLGLCAIGPVAAAAALYAALPGLHYQVRALFGLRASSKRIEGGRFGDRNWLSLADTRTLSARGGLIIGQENAAPDARLVHYPIEAHGLVFAPSRSGKGLLIAANLLSPGGGGHDGPVVVVDPKAEAFFVAGDRRRALGRTPLLLDPFNIVARHRAGAAAVGFNPLRDFVRPDHLVGDLAILTEAILPTTGDDASPSATHFINGARSLIAGFCAWVIHSEPAENQTLGRVRQLLLASAAEMELTIEAILDQAPDGLAGDAARFLGSLGSDERGSMISTTANALRFLTFPEVTRCLAASDFDLEAIARNEVDLFICVPDDLIEQQAALVRMFLAMVLALVSRVRPAKRILLLLDEMAVLGRLDPIVRAFSIAAGKGVSVVGFSQSPHDLAARYGEKTAKSMIANAEVVTFFEVPPADVETAEQVSKLVGEYTELETTSSANIGVGGKAVSAGMSESAKYSQRRVISPDEVREMKAGDAIVLIRSKIVPKRPVWLRIPKYYERNDMKPLAGTNPLR